MRCAPPSAQAGRPVFQAQRLGTEADLLLMACPGIIAGATNPPELGSATADIQVPSRWLTTAISSSS